MNIKSIKDFNIEKKRLFLRLDLNTPLKETNGVFQVKDSSRIYGAIPTIEYALKNGAKVIIATHVGRPNGKVVNSFCVEPIALKLAEILNQDIIQIKESIGDGVEMMIHSMNQGQAILLENLRFHPGEEKNDLEFSKCLSRFTDIYVNDAFGTMHRKHASTFGLPSLVPKKGIGFLVEKELKYLSPLLHDPKRPFYAVLGGAKVKDKISAIESLIRNSDGVFIGGKMAHAFKKVKEGSPGNEEVEYARKAISLSEKLSKEITLPLDTNNGFDIGEKTIDLFSSKLSDGSVIFINGPMGFFEKPEYSTGTFSLFKEISKINCLKIAGGGDTLRAINEAGVSEKFDHLSTGGGVLLEYLKGKGLEGLKALL